MVEDVKPAAARLEEVLEARPGGGLDLRLIARAGEARDRHLAQADEELERVIDELVRAGDRANLSVAARLVGVARDTLYRRLDQRGATPTED